MDIDYSFNANTCEIVEAREEIICKFKIDEKPESSCAHKSGKKYSIEDDINRLLQAIDIENSARALNTPDSQKSALKKPIKITSSQTSGIGLSEPVSLKQAFRGLCISHASKMAALKRLSKPSTSSRVSKVGISRPSNELGCNDNNEISNSSAHHSPSFVNATNPKPMSTTSFHINIIINTNIVSYQLI